MGAVLIFILLALLWVVLIVPRQREVRRHNALVASLEVGDDVMTGAGIYGTITALGDDDVWVEVAPDVTIRLAKRAIGSKVAPEPELETADDDVDADDDAADDAGNHAADDDAADDAGNHAADDATHSQIDRTED